ncbi:MAG: oligoendopeptidase F, partial [Anaerolineae bacterium]|nr:oligoendopeptidase F [Anaerolineae bacterium]
MNENGYELGPWRLEELFSAVDSPAIDEAIAELERQADAFAAYREQLAPDMAGTAFRALLDDYEAIVRHASRLRGYAGLNFAADTQN